MRRALVVARRTFRVPRCLRTCVRRVGGGCFTREVFREQDASATDASATDASATDATDATATAEAVTEGKRPRPDADSVPVEQPDADAMPSGRARRRVHVFPTPLTAFAACLRVTAVRLRRDAQQPTPDAEALFGPEALFHEAFERFREAADAARETRVRADEAVGLVENAGNALGLGMTIDQLRKNEKDAAEKTADNARAANIAANAASVCQRTAKDFDHVAHQRAAVADVAAADARERLAVAGGSGIVADVLETVASAKQARAVAQRARKLSNHAVNVLNATLADSAAADAQRQRAAALAADAAADAAAAAAAAAAAEANAANAANEAGDGNIDAVAAAAAAAAAAAVEANAANEAGDGNIDAVVAATAAAAAAADDDDEDDEDDDLIAAAPARDANDDVRADEENSPEMSIKCSLKTFVCLPDDQETQFVERLSEIVAVMSKLRVRAFHAVTLFLMRTLQNPVQYPDVFFGSLVHGKLLAGKSGDKFWREAMRDPQERAEPEPVITLLRAVRHECAFPALVIPGGVCAILNSVAKELSTAFRNHLSENFFPRQLQKHRVVVLELHHETPGGIVAGTTDTELRKGINELAHWLSRRVNLKVTDPVSFSRLDQAATSRFDALPAPIQEKLREHVVAERDALGLAEHEFVSRARLRSKDPARVMRLLRWTWTALNDIVRFRDDPNLEVLRALKLRIRAFCICPQSTIQAAHVPIDAHSFFLLGANLGFWGYDERQLFTGNDMIKRDLALLKQNLQHQGIPQREIDASLRDRRAALNRDVKNRRRVDYWYRVFNVKKLRRGRRKLDFAEHVRTDGVSISVLFHRLDHRSVSPMTKNRQKAEKTLREATADELAMLRIIGIDPGRICLCYGTEEIIAAAPNDEARRLLIEQLAAFDGPPALMNAGAGGAHDGGAHDGDAGDGDAGAGDDDDDDADADADADDAGADDAGVVGARRRPRPGGRGYARRRRRAYRANRNQRRPRRGRGSRGIRRARRSYKSYMLTRAWYYRRAGIDAANKQSRRWLENDDVSVAFEALRDLTVKTTDFDTYKLHVDAYVQHYDTLWAEKLRPRWARQKFRLYCGKRRALQEFVNNLRGGGEITPLIAYGNAGFASGGRGERSVPVKGIKRLIRQTYPTVLVDEYNTTKMCLTCHVPLQHVKVRIQQRDESWKTTTCHDLRRCGNRGPGGCAVLGCSWKNRDEVASLNIGRCARLNALRAGHDVANRPACLRRRAPGQPRHPDKTVFLCRPEDPATRAPKKIGHGS